MARRTVLETMNRIRISLDDVEWQLSVLDWLLRQIPVTDERPAPAWMADVQFIERREIGDLWFDTYRTGGDVRIADYGRRIIDAEGVVRHESAEVF